MKYIKRFNESQTEQEIHELCRKYDITNYVINSDGSIDVDNGVAIRYVQLTKLPLKFNKVTGYFSCRSNKLGCPNVVGGNFNCSLNQLTSLEGCSKEIVGSFNCRYNPIHEICSIFNDYKDLLKSLDYNYLRGNKVYKLRLERALEEQNLLGKLPNRLENYEYI